MSIWQKLFGGTQQPATPPVQPSVEKEDYNRLRRLVDDLTSAEGMLRDPTAETVDKAIEFLRDFMASQEDLVKLAQKFEDAMTDYVTPRNATDAKGKPIKRPESYGVLSDAEARVLQDLTKHSVFDIVKELRAATALMRSGTETEYSLAKLQITEALEKINTLRLALSRYSDLLKKMHAVQ